MTNNYVATKRFDKVLFLNKILPLILIIIFTVRLFSYDSNIVSIIGLNNSPINSFLSVVTMLSIWLNYTFIILIIMNNYFNVRVIKLLSKYVAIPIFIINLVLIYPTIVLFLGSFKFSVLLVLYICELLIAIVLCINVIIKEKDLKFSKNDLLFTFGILILLMIASMPSYTLQFLFGYAKTALQIKDISFAHRLFIYPAIVIPFVMYFMLRNKSEDTIRFTLIYVSIATLVGFLVNYSYHIFATPWKWPFHLCNTAMFIIPICLIFRFKKLFYFTYFINVFGALLAMLMPNYDAGTNIFSMRIFNFWYNHYIAFFMPLLIVALKQFKRPTIKEFSWSMVWFFAYFILVLFLNVYFSALGHNVDYFFINSNFIADKLGNWAEQIFNLTTHIKIGDYDLVFHPLYQILYFIVYILLGLGIWFIYVEMFKVADSHYELRLKLKQMKQIEYAKSSVIGKSRKEEMMNKEIIAEMKLNHFSKKYATSKKYAVKDANLEIKAGDVFGFLGPNGAGKSTIIKSIVGIQPITEGSIDICGFDVQADPVLAKYNIGYVPDHYALYEKLTGREYINYIADIYEVPKEERDERIKKYVKLFELEASIDSKIRTYSHGMKQKITIISALVHNPKVWILDEPLTGLDPNSIFQVKECMKQHAAEGNIVFFSSHLIDIVEKLCNRIAIIKHGHIQCDMTLEEIESKNISLEQFYLNIIGNNEDCD